MDYRKAYADWRALFALDQDMIRELDQIEKDEAELEDRFYTELSFGTAGMRGVLGAGLNRMNVPNVRRATKGLADYINEVGGAARGVVIAYDSRRMSPEFAKEAALVLAASGIRAMLFPQLRPVPVLSFAVRYLNAIAGIVITASHNPKQYNGYKVYWEDGAQMPPDRADAVLARIRARAYADALPMDEAQAEAKDLLVTVDPSVDDAYIEKVKTLAVQPQLLRMHGSQMHIVYTPLHGSGNIPVRRVLGEMGVSNLLVVSEQERPDPDFPTVPVPNPEEPETFRLAIAMANENGADACFATDPDCDRLGVATRGPDGTFRLLTGNQIGCLLLHYILSTRHAQGTLPSNGAVVKSIVSTELARDIAAHYGVDMVDTLTGFKFIAEQIERFEETGEHTFLFGFEESYGYLSSTFVRDKDAVNASLLVTELALSLKLEGKTLWDRLEEIYAQYGYCEDRVTSITLPGKDGVLKMQQIMRRLREGAPASIGGLRVLAGRDYLSGVRSSAAGDAPIDLPKSDVLYYELEGGCWLCIRPSGTEPKIKLYVSARAKERQTAAALAEGLLSAARELLA